MSPTRLRKRPSIRTKASHLPKTNPSSNSIKPVIQITKRDKRERKHTAFLNRIVTPNQSVSKCRRPSKKLVATLNSLRDMLPDSEDLTCSRDFNKNTINAECLNSQPGAMKRKAKLERYEKSRFDQNLKQLVDVGQEHSISDNHTSTDKDVIIEPEMTLVPQPTAVAARFAAIRAWANDNLHMHPDIKLKSC